jgi:hypothetical protein
MIRSRTLRVAALALAVAALAVPATGATATGPHLAVISFAGTARAGGTRPPGDAVKPGGTYGSCYISRLKRLYAFLRYSGMRAGSPASVAWSVNGSQVFVDRFAWDLGKKGASSVYLHANGRVLPDGLYTVSVRVGGRLLARASVTRVSLYC